MNIFVSADPGVATWSHIAFLAAFLPVGLYAHLKTNRGWGYSGDYFDKHPYAVDTYRRLAFATMPILLGWTMGTLGMLGIRLFIVTGVDGFGVLGLALIASWVVFTAWALKEFLRPSGWRAEREWVTTMFPTLRN